MKITEYTMGHMHVGVEGGAIGIAETVITIIIVIFVGICIVGTIVAMIQDARWGEDSGPEPNHEHVPQPQKLVVGGGKREYISICKTCGMRISGFI